MDILKTIEKLYAEIDAEKLTLGQNRNEFRQFLTFANAYFKLREIEHPIVVEIGIFEGAQKRFYVELLGAEHIGIDNNRDRKYVPDITGDSHAPETLDKLKAKLAGRPIDLLFIDGDHSYDSVKRDYENYGSLTKHMIVLHDIHTEKWVYGEIIDVYKVWAEIIEKEPSHTYMTFRNLNLPDFFGGYQMGIGLIIKDQTPKQAIETINKSVINPRSRKHRIIQSHRMRIKERDGRLRADNRMREVRKMLHGEDIPVFRLDEIKEGKFERANILNTGCFRINVCIPSIGRDRIIDSIDTLLRSTCRNYGIIVVMQENKEMAENLIHRYREYKQVEIIFEPERRGWVWAQNLVAKRPGCLFAAADDIVVMRETLRVLEVSMQILFPDTDGIIATGLTQPYWMEGEVDFPIQGWPGAFPFIGDKFMERFPGRQIFCPDYFAAGADPELYHYGMYVNKFIQSLDAKLIHFEPRSKDIPNDKTKTLTVQAAQDAIELYLKRRDSGYLWGKNFDLVRATT